MHVPVVKTLKVLVAVTESPSKAHYMDNNLILTWAASIIAVGGALGILWKIISPIVLKTKNLLDSLSRFTTDWFGEDAMPGRDRVPGVMERLNRIDGELQHNSGSSMKDAMRRIENKLAEIDGRLEEGNKRFEEIEQRID
jgi:hypothetical protein